MPLPTANQIDSLVDRNITLLQTPEAQAILAEVQRLLAAQPQVQALEARLDKIAPGWKTSEFWMTALSQLILIVTTLEGVLPAKYAALAGVIVQVGYTLSRGIAKHGSPVASGPLPSVNANTASTVAPEFPPPGTPLTVTTNGGTRRSFN